MCAKQVKKPGEVPTTGHEWDGIREYDNPMPRWWLYTFYLCIIWAIGYTFFYPAWPLVASATQGLWGTEAAGDTRLAVAAEIKRFDEANGPMKAKLVATDLIGQQADADGHHQVERHKSNQGRVHVERPGKQECGGSRRAV